MVRIELEASLNFLKEDGARHSKNMENLLNGQRTMAWALAQQSSTVRELEIQLRQSRSQPSAHYECVIRSVENDAWSWEAKGRKAQMEQEKANQALLLQEFNFQILQDRLKQEVKEKEELLQRLQQLHQERESADARHKREMETLNGDIEGKDVEILSLREENDTAFAAYDQLISMMAKKATQRDLINRLEADLSSARQLAQTEAGRRFEVLESKNKASESYEESKAAWKELLASKEEAIFRTDAEAR